MSELGNMVAANAARVVPEAVGQLPGEVTPPVVESEVCVAASGVTYVLDFRSAETGMPDQRRSAWQRNRLGGATDAARWQPQLA